jgi:hypothetical protein
MTRTRSPWTDEATATLKRMAGRPDSEIASATGFSVRTVREYRRALGICAFQNRGHWTRRDWLLADAAGLDFSMSL